jgi:hypothetical protein
VCIRDQKSRKAKLGEEKHESNVILEKQLVPKLMILLEVNYMVSFDESGN